MPSRSDDRFTGLPGEPQKPPQTQTAKPTLRPVVSNTPSPSQGVATDESGKLPVSAPAQSLVATSRNPDDPKIGQLWYRQDLNQICIKDDDGNIYCFPVSGSAAASWPTLHEFSIATLSLRPSYATPPSGTSLEGPPDPDLGDGQVMSTYVDPDSYPYQLRAVNSLTDGFKPVTAGVADDLDNGPWEADSRWLYGYVRIGPTNSSWDCYHIHTKGPDHGKIEFGIASISETVDALAYSALPNHYITPARVVILSVPAHFGGGGLDCYNATYVKNQVVTPAFRLQFNGLPGTPATVVTGGVTDGGPGLYAVYGRSHTKNVASTGYRVGIQAAWLARTDYQTYW